MGHCTEPRGTRWARAYRASKLDVSYSLRIATGLSWICYFRALSLGQASKVAPVDKLSVIFVILLAAPILGEALTAKKMLGGVLIAAGAIVLAFS